MLQALSMAVPQMLRMIREAELPIEMQEVIGIIVAPNITDGLNLQPQPQARLMLP